MKVIFLKHVINVAKEGEVKEVKPGYAINSLIPQGLAKKLTPELEARMKNQAKKEDLNRIALKTESSDIVSKLEGQRLEFFLKWDAKKVFGSITEKDVVPLINKLAGVTITKKYVIFSGGNIKTFGEHIAHVKFDAHNVARIIIDVKPQV